MDITPAMKDKPKPGHWPNSPGKGRSSIVWVWSFLVLADICEYHPLWEVYLCRNWLLCWRGSLEQNPSSSVAIFPSLTWEHLDTCTKQAALCQEMWYTSVHIVLCVWNPQRKACVELYCVLTLTRLYILLRGRMCWDWNACLWFHIIYFSKNTNCTGRCKYHNTEFVIVLDVFDIYLCNWML